jgi:hypothetical protein
MLQNDSLRLPPFYFDADLDATFNSDEDPDPDPLHPGSSVPDPSHFGTDPDRDPHH